MASCLKEILYLAVFSLLVSSVFVECAEPEISNPPGQFTVVRPYVDPEGTTPAICPNATRCGFQLYDRDTGSTHNKPFVTYCECPEGTSCEKAGHSLNMAFYWYLCKNMTEETTTEPMSREETTTEPMSREGKHLLFGADDSGESGRFSSRVGFLSTRNEL